MEEGRKLSFDDISYSPEELRLDGPDGSLLLSGGKPRPGGISEKQRPVAFPVSFFSAGSGGLIRMWKKEILTIIFIFSADA